jgi:hypothetical protein
MVNPAVNLGINSSIIIPTTSFDKKSFALHLIY